MTDKLCCFCEKMYWTSGQGETYDAYECSERHFDVIIGVEGLRKHIRRAETCKDFEPVKESK